MRYTKEELNLVFEDALIYQVRFFDQHYVLTTEAYLIGEGLTAYHQHLGRIMGVDVNDLYELHTFDCEDFAIGYRQFLVMMHRRYHQGMRAGLAVGFGVHRNLHHALNLAIVLREGALCVRIYEPQPTGGVIDVSDTMYYSGFSWVLL